MRKIKLEVRFIRFRLMQLLLAISVLNPVRLNAFNVSDNAQFSVLTCTPGPDLYSLFGHSAIRYQDSVNGRWVDWVYNYGTFQFDDSFYLKFARGKLDYILSKQDFPYFQEEYIFTGRGIFEQRLIFDKEDNQRLLNLLEENYLPENRTYRYDFFYDNCSTRIRDIIIRATSGKADQLGFIHPDPAVIAAMSRIDFTYVYPESYSYRDAIQTYLDYQPWSDFGIDLALGLPCDKRIEKGGYMFLPDSVLNEFNYAIYQDRALVAQADEILPRDYELSANSLFTPVMVMMMVLLFHAVLSFVLIRRGIVFHFADRTLFFITGLLGVFIVFLWFFTDHTATKWNLNLLWANPVNLILAFIPQRGLSGWRNYWVISYFFILSALLLFWFFLPQKLNLALVPLIAALLFTCLKVIRPTLFLGSKSGNV